jgi:hypothetical protein
MLTHRLLPVAWAWGEEARGNAIGTSKCGESDDGELWVRTKGRVKTLATAKASNPKDSSVVQSRWDRLSPSGPKTDVVNMGVLLR